MIVWGGSDGIQHFKDRREVQSWHGHLDSLPARPTRRPPRSGHTAVWTGSQMIVWGGSGTHNQLNTGGRYNPGTNSWTATSTTNAPAGRYSHTRRVDRQSNDCLGRSQVSGIGVNTGGRYNPSTNSWTATSTTNAPDSSTTITQQCGLGLR